MAENPEGGPFKDDKTRRSGLDRPLQSAAEGRLSKEIRLQQLQQESAPEGILWMKLEMFLSALCECHNTALLMVDCCAAFVII